jgi:AcrR family transcriptional regulator
VGLRERNAARTREHILDTALPLFLDQGYEATTMEEVAERAQVGTTTLYRYFGTKEQLALGPIAQHGQMATELSQRPTDEPLDLALGHALRALLTTQGQDPERLRRVKAVVDRTPSLQVRLAEEFVGERTLLERAVSERLGRPADDVFCVVTARLATVVLELGVDAVWSALEDDPEDAEKRVLGLVGAILQQLQAEPPVVPRLTSG